MCVCVREAAPASVQQHAQRCESAGLAAAARRSKQPHPHEEPDPGSVRPVSNCRTGECVLMHRCTLREACYSRVHVMACFANLAGMPENPAKFDEASGS